MLKELNREEFQCISKRVKQERANLEGGLYYRLDKNPLEAELIKEEKSKVIKQEIKLDGRVTYEVKIKNLMAK